MNKILKRVSLLLVGALTLTSCTDYFDKINDNPNSPSPDAVEPMYVLTFVQNRSCFPNTEYQVIQQLTVDHFAEYLANDVLSASRYNIEDRYVNAIWNDTYTYIADMVKMIEANQDKPEQTNVVQMCRIWKAWMILRLTDYLGDVPYSQAGKGEAAPYDTQKDIYYTVFDELRDAITKFDDAQKNPKGQDLVYGGDNARWIKFANSLRLRMALRISLVDPAKAQQEAEDAVAKGVMTSNDETASVQFGDANSGNFGTHPYYTLHTFGGFNMSNAFLKIVEGLGGQPWPASVPATEHPAIIDPRAPLMFDPSSKAMGAEDQYVGRYVGTDPGLIEPGSSSALPGGEKSGNVARYGVFMYGDPARRFPILKYSEVCLLQAEGLWRGWNVGNAENGTTIKALYENGIRANMAEYGIEEATVTAYLASTSPNTYGTTVKFEDTAGDANTVLDKIITQKYLTFYLENSWQAWADHRRLHKPTLMVFKNVDPSYFVMDPVARANNLPAAYIKRGYYPNNEYVYNAKHVNEAVARMGGKDDVQHNVWWDVD